MSDHSLLSASSGSRWKKCPISVTGVKSGTNRAAAEGTMLHGFSEGVFAGAAWPAVGTEHDVDGFKFTFDSSMLADAKVYTDYVQSRPWLNGFHVEARVHYGRMLDVPHEFAFGTSDVWGFTESAEDGRVLEIIDAKFGRKAVSPEQSYQMGLYAAGVLEAMSEMPLPRTHKVRLTIVQPRLSHRPFSWMTTVGWVEDLMMEMRPAAKAAVAFHLQQADQKLHERFPEVAGAHCQYCARQPQCYAFQSTLASLGNGKPQWNPLIFSMREAIREHLEAIEEQGLTRALAGDPPAGTKLVAGRAGNAKLVASKEQVLLRAQQLGVQQEITWIEQAWATPAKIRDALKRGGVRPDEMSKYIEQPPGAPVLAMFDDPRPTWSPANTSMFTGVDR